MLYAVEMAFLYEFLEAGEPGGYTAASFSTQSEVEEEAYSDADSGQES
jgi:hypothetical protein